MICFLKPKHTICSVLVLSCVLFGCSTIRHGVYLSGSEEQIRAEILKITPLGTPIEKAKASIQTRIHPETLYYYEHGGNLPNIIKDGRAVRGQWPLGGEHHRKEIACEIGQGGLYDEDDVGAVWAFDDNDRLIDVFVYKTPNLP